MNRKPETELKLQDDFRHGSCLDGPAYGSGRMEPEKLPEKAPARAYDGQFAHKGTYFLGGKL